VIRSTAQGLLVALTALVVLAPLDAWACPYCAGREDAGVTGVVLLGAMILLPFLIVATVVPVLRRAALEADGHAPTDTE
jgi:hypothetical protein